MIAHPRHLRSRRGFTLLELMVAMSMVAIIAASLYAALAIAFKARSSARAQTEVVGSAMIALDVLEQDFRNAVSPEGALTAPFIGSTQRIGLGGIATVSFCTMGRDPFATGESGNANPFFDGRRWVELSAVSTGEDLTLVRRIGRNLLTDSAFEIEEEPLITGLASFEVRYFDGYDWLDEWDSELVGNVMPHAVEIVMEFDQPAPIDPSRNYRLRQVIPLPLGKEPALTDSTGAMP
jgi:general secretion pathway protein J